MRRLGELDAAVDDEPRLDESPRELIRSGSTAV